MLSASAKWVALHGGVVHKGYDAELRERGWIAEQVWVTACGLALFLPLGSSVDTMLAEEFDAGRMLAPFTPTAKVCVDCFGVRV